MKVTTTAAVAMLSIAALGLTGCAESKRDDSGKSGGSGSGAAAKGNSDATLTFGAAGAPATFDPFWATDGETFRVSRQIFEGLVGFKPGTADVQPGLATSWTPSKDGKTWTFKLRTGVKFTDGQPFNADAVCKNFERMDKQSDAGQTAGEYWLNNMGGFNKSAEDLYKGCTPKGSDSVDIKIARPTSKFPQLLGLSSFAMQSPKALDQYKANNITAQGDGFAYPEYSQKHPTGTGPFKFQSYDVANKTVTLVRNDDYWGPKATIKKLVFQIIPDETARKQALEAGQIDGYDLPNPVDWPTLKSKDNLEVRQPFNILYLGLNAQANPALKDLKVRQALYYAIDRDKIVKQQLPEGATAATQFIPKTVDGFSTNTMKYDYNKDKAKSLLKEAGQSNLKIDLWYPSEVSRPYMPDPQKIFQSIKSDWEAIGVKVNPVTKPWSGGYVTATQQGKAPAYLMGWTGDYNTPDNFLGNFFSDTKGQMTTGAYPWGKTLASDLSKADSIVDKGARTEAYKKINEQIMKDYLPGLPISSSPPAIVFGKNISGVVASPLTAELFATAVKK